MYQAAPTTTAPLSLRVRNDIDLIEIENGGMGVGGKKMGRPSKEIIQKLAIKYEDKHTGNLYWACIAHKNALDMRCNHLRKGNAQESRIIAHALECPKISESLKKWVAQYAANSAPGAKLGGTALVEVGERKEDASILPERSGDSGMSAIFSKGKEASKPLKQPSLDLIIGEKGKAQDQTEYDHAMVLLVAVGGVVPNLFDKPVWKHVVKVLTKNGTHRNTRRTSASTVLDSLIPRENAYVEKCVRKHLATQQNMSITFDGTNTKKDSVYTSHVTTEDRQTFFTEAINASEYSHNAEWVRDFILDVRILPSIHAYANESDSVH